MSIGEGRREVLMRKKPTEFWGPLDFQRLSNNILTPDSSKHEAEKGRLQNTWSFPS